MLFSFSVGNISAHISRDRAHKDDGYHNAEENHNHDRVNNAEPVYFGVENVQIIVPTGSLRDIDLTSSFKAVILTRTHGVSDS